MHFIPLACSSSHLKHRRRGLAEAGYDDGRNAPRTNRPPTEQDEARRRWLAALWDWTTNDPVSFYTAVLAYPTTGTRFSATRRFNRSGSSSPIWKCASGNRSGSKSRPARKAGHDRSWPEGRRCSRVSTRCPRRRGLRCAQTRGDGPNRWTTRRRPAHHPCEGVQKSQKVPWHKIRSERIWGWG